MTTGTLERTGGSTATRVGLFLLVIVIVAMACALTLANVNTWKPGGGDGNMSPTKPVVTDDKVYCAEKINATRRVLAWAIEGGYTLLVTHGQEFSAVVKVIGENVLFGYITRPGENYSFTTMVLPKEQVLNTLAINGVKPGQTPVEYLFGEYSGKVTLGEPVKHANAYLRDDLGVRTAKEDCLPAPILK